jgi:diguanylate cyclase (GGDEF)-like protein
LVGAAAALAAGLASYGLDDPAAIAGLAAAATAPAAALFAHWLIIRPARVRAAADDRLVLEAQQRLVAERADRAARRELDRALDQAEDEPATLAVICQALSRRFADHQIEVHLVDPVEPILVVQIALGRPDGAVGHRSSPWDPLVTRIGSTLVYDTTERVDACTHLRERAGEAVSAVALPLIAAGRILGLVYVFGPDGEKPDRNDVLVLEEFASTMAVHLAVTRTKGTAIRADSIDRLTGLPDRAAMQNRLVKLLADRAPFTVAIADIDDFGAFNDRHGRPIGDSALALLGRVARRTIRPHDLVGRVGGDELLFVMPDTSPEDTSRAIERIREEMFVSQSSSHGSPRFTISAGVVGSGAGLTIDSLLTTAAAALRSARHLGGNRIIVGAPIPEPT